MEATATQVPQIEAEKLGCETAAHEGYLPWRRPASGTSARRVKQPADRFQLPRESIVDLDGFGCRQDVCYNLPLLQEFQRLAWDVEALFHSAREHHNRGAMIQQFLHVRGLNSRNMSSARFPPVPFSRSTWKKLRVFVWPSDPPNFKPPPGDMLDQR